MLRSREAARGSYINHITLILFCTEKITMYQSKYSLLHSSAQQFRWTFPCFLHLTKTSQRKYHQTALLNNTSCTSYTLPIFHSVFFLFAQKVSMSQSVVFTVLWHWFINCQYQTSATGNSQIIHAISFLLLVTFMRTALIGWFNHLQRILNTKWHKQTNKHHFMAIF